MSFFSEISASVFVISYEPLITGCVRGFPVAAVGDRPSDEVVAENLWMVFSMTPDFLLTFSSNAVLFVVIVGKPDAAVSSDDAG